MRDGAEPGLLFSGIGKKGKGLSGQTKSREEAGQVTDSRAEHSLSLDSSLQVGEHWGCG